MERRVYELFQNISAADFIAAYRTINFRPYGYNHIPNTMIYMYGDISSATSENIIKDEEYFIDIQTTRVYDGIPEYQFLFINKSTNECVDTNFLEIETIAGASISDDTLRRFSDAEIVVMILNEVTE